MPIECSDSCGLSVERCGDVCVSCALLAAPHPTEASREETATIKGRPAACLLLLHEHHRCGLGKCTRGDVKYISSLHGRQVRMTRCSFSYFILWNCDIKQSNARHCLTDF